MKGIQGTLLLVLGAAACQPTANIAPAPKAPLETTVTDVLRAQILVGEMVQVSGRCLVPGAPDVALGSRPVASPVWQLEDNGNATWVVGKVPDNCGNGTTTVTARIAQDTLPKLSAQRWVRQYLVTR